MIMDLLDFLCCQLSCSLDELVSKVEQEQMIGIARIVMSHRYVSPLFPFKVISCERLSVWGADIERCCTGGPTVEEALKVEDIFLKHPSLPCVISTNPWGSELKYPLEILGII